MTKKKTIHDFIDMKARGEKIAFLTAYDYPTAQFAQAAGLDMLLVGDSLGMCVYGYSGTVPVTMEQCIGHAEAVRRGAPDTFVVGDMPFMSYQTSCEAAVENAGRFLKEAGADPAGLAVGFVNGELGLTPGFYFSHVLRLLQFGDFLSGIGKSVFFAFAIGLIASYNGLSATGAHGSRRREPRGAAR